MRLELERKRNYLGFVSLVDAKAKLSLAASIVVIIRKLFGIGIVSWWQ